MLFFYFPSYSTKRDDFYLFCAKNKEGIYKPILARGRKSFAYYTREEFEQIKEDLMMYNCSDNSLFIATNNVKNTFKKSYSFDVRGKVLYHKPFPKNDNDVEIDENVLNYILCFRCYIIDKFSYQSEQEFIKDVKKTFVKNCEYSLISLEEGRYCLNFNDISSFKTNNNIFKFNWGDGYRNYYNYFSLEVASCFNEFHFETITNLSKGSTIEEILFKQLAFKTNLYSERELEDIIKKELKVENISIESFDRFSLIENGKLQDYCELGASYFLDSFLLPEKVFSPEKELIKKLGASVVEFKSGKGNEFVCSFDVND